MTPLYTFLKLFEINVYIPSYLFTLQAKDSQVFLLLLTGHGIEYLSSVHNLVDLYSFYSDGCKFKNHSKLI